MTKNTLLGLFAKPSLLAGTAFAIRKGKVPIYRKGGVHMLRKVSFISALLFVTVVFLSSAYAQEKKGEKKKT
jgi:hypothetical protein